MYFNMYDVFYSQYSHQHLVAGNPAIFRVTLLQEYSCGLLCHHYSTIITIADLELRYGMGGGVLKSGVYGGGDYALSWWNCAS
jgi:hypothetical protein